MGCNQGGVLTDAHRRQLEHDSAISAEVLAEEDIRSCASSLQLPRPAAELRHSNSHKGQHFGIWGETDKQHRPLDLGPGIWFGTRDVSDRLSGQYRPDRPRTSVNGHTIKYETCRGTRPSFAVPKRCREPLVDSKCDVFFTEGIKKALAIASAGACAISLNGVDAWSVRPQPDAPSEPIDDFDAVSWHGRTVWIAYDSDAREKDGVGWAERRLTKELSSRGAVVIPLRIPHRPDGSKRGVDDYLADRLAAGVSRADALAELTSVALAELLRLSKITREPIGGTDGGETCRSCPELREQLREYKLADQLRRAKSFSAAEVEVARYYCRQAAVAISQGKPTASVWSEETERMTGQSAASATRLHKAWRTLQSDPEIGPTLPFQIASATRDGKEHIELVVPVDVAEPAERTTAALLATVAHLPRLPGRARHGGERVSCPQHPDAPVHRTRIWRCMTDGCGWVHQDTAVLGDQADTVTIAGEPYAVDVQAPTPFHDETVPSATNGDVSEPSDGGPFHDETIGTLTYSALPELVPPDGPFHDETVVPPQVLIPVSMVSRDDMEAAKAPAYWGEAPPEPPPPPPRKELPLAPSSHIARGFIRRMPPSAVMGGGS